ncbi:MAG TPA: S41 family peptidase [Chitinophagaceae bacterium]|nr:S41 family peptidase [Chitinophagaceae bacterium]
MMGNKKLQVWLPLIFSIVMVAGMFLGYQLNSRGGNGRGFFAADKRGALQEVVDLIQLRYVDSVQMDSLEGKAIREMINELDPHSVYFPPVDLAAANEELEGSFDGIGVEFNVFNDTVNVVYVIPNGPSDKAGLQIGDKIITVNDSALVRKDLSSDLIKKFIKGPSGSEVALKVMRDKQMKTVSVTRGTIPVSSIDAAYMITNNIGYLKLNKFSKTSYEEFMASMEALKKKGMQHLVFDLRGNGGGLMDEAVDMADEFLDGDKLIVYTQGVNSKKREYRCKRPGIMEEGKVVVLVDELSASASEVLAGALQDWCRATIVGRRTFGKGLVQEQYPLSDGSAVRLTVARYYTPLGRSIQRSYEKGKKVYMDELWDRFSNGEMLSADSLKAKNNGKQYTNSCNDTLYGGDGISPDVFVPYDTSRAIRKTFSLISHGGFGSYVYNYYLGHKAKFDQYKSVKEYLKDYSNNNELWDGLLKSLAGDTTGFIKATPTEKAIIELRLKASLARYKWRDSGFYEVLSSDDNVITKATELISQ